ncbi:MAG: hypothetical protein J07HX5_00424 [halophilic archaeon J07HX5]|nr:MAG: hypothetical protein J07HX5_00424 [halophilic archaeon J07HX5]
MWAREHGQAAVVLSNRAIWLSWEINNRRQAHICVTQYPYHTVYDDWSPSNQFAWSIPLLLAVVVLIGLAGGSIVIANLVDSGPPDPPSSVEAAERLDDLDTIELVGNRTRQVDGNTSWAVTERAVRIGTGKFRDEIVAAGSERASATAGSLSVSNGSVRYTYIANTDRLFRSEVNESEQSERSENVRNLFAAVGDELDQSVPIFPTFSPSESSNSSTEWRDTAVTVEYRGTETVAGRDNYVLQLEPVTDDVRLVSATLWFDQEYLYPLQYNRVIDRPEGRYNYTFTPQTITFNPSLEDSLFEFDAERLSADPAVFNTERFDSYAEMAAALDRPTPKLSLSEEFDFVGGSRFDGPTQSLSYRYADGVGEDATVVRVFVTDQSAEYPGNETITIGGQQVTRSTSGGDTEFSWQRGDWNIVVSGTADQSTLRSIVGTTLTDGGD